MISLKLRLHSDVTDNQKENTNFVYFDTGKKRRKMEELIVTKLSEIFTGWNFMKSKILKRFK